MKVRRRKLEGKYLKMKSKHKVIKLTKKFLNMIKMESLNKLMKHGSQRVLIMIRKKKVRM